MDKQVIAGTEAPVRAILPKLNVVQIGGMSIMDRGSSAVLPVLDEILANTSPGRSRSAPASRPS